VSEESDISKELDGSFVSDVRSWKGQVLAPYTEGSRILMAQIRGKEDVGLYFIYAFLFLHLELKKDRRNAIRLCWDKDAFREAVLDFSSEMSINDRDHAASIVTSILDEAEKAETEAIPSPKPLGPPGNG
jgi:hypothetical protein